MPTYLELLKLVLPVFALMGIGIGLRRIHWVEGEAEASLMKLVVNVCMPCLIFVTVAGNAAVRDPANVFWPPVLGFAFTTLGIAACYFAGRAVGLTVGGGLRTFALTAGVTNFGYLPLPIMAGIWGPESQGVLLVHNVGVEMAVWTVGLLVLSGLSPRQGWRRLFSPMLGSILLALALNLSGWAGAVPEPVYAVVRALGACAIPLGLVLIGVTMAHFVSETGALLHGRTTTAACVLRLLVLPVIMLALTRWLPVSVELKRVLVIQAAMPSATFPIVMARHFGGHPLTAVQVMVGTTAVGILTIPFWIQAGLRWVGVG